MAPQQPWVKGGEESEVKLLIEQHKCSFLALLSEMALWTSLFLSNVIPTEIFLQKLFPF